MPKRWLIGSCYCDFLSHPEGGEHRDTPAVTGKTECRNAGRIGYRYLLSHPWGGEHGNTPAEAGNTHP